MHHRWLCPFRIALLIVTASVSRPAHADDPAGARVSYEAATRHYNMAEYEQALQAFKDAYRQKPDPAFLYNIGQCHRMLGHLDEAVAVYRSYVREAPDAKNRAEVERKIDDLEAQRVAAAGSARAAETRLLVAASTLPDRASPEAPSSSRPDMLVASAPAAPKASRPMHRQWWFWTTVGALAAGAAVTVGILVTRDPTKIPGSDLGSQRVLP